MIRAADIHARVSWPAVLERLGIEARFLRNRHGPCPACGGKDRFRFDNKRGRGSFYCNQCGAGDGFALLQRVRGWSFAEARREVLAVAGSVHAVARHDPIPAAVTAVASPTRRVLQVLGSSCAVADCPDAVAYLERRHLWPLPAGCTLRAHAALKYWEDGHDVGRFPALIGEVRDVADQLVTCAVTYLQGGQKLTGHTPRKLLSPLTGHTGGAVRLLRLDGPTLGIGEGIETCLSAALVGRVPVWAALSTALLAKFEPAPGVALLKVYADRDEAGLRAARQLMERLKDRTRTELHIPPEGAKDWNAVLMNDSKCLGNC